MTTYLILHSDDFGLHTEINQAIFKAFDKGMLTSASLMANGLATDEAIEGILKRPDLGVGIHFNILRGYPLSDPARINTLVDKNGRFLNSMPRLLLRSFAGRIKPSHIQCEYRNQLMYLIEQGIQPTHIDSEKHCHLLIPQAMQAINQIADEFKLKKVRRINESPLLDHLSAVGIQLKKRRRQRVKVALLEYCTRRANKIWTDLISPEYSFGVSLDGVPSHRNAANMLQIFSSISGNIHIEWIFHLGHPLKQTPSFNNQYGPFLLDTSGRDEMEFLLSEDTLKAITHNAIELINYSDL